MNGRGLAIDTRNFTASTRWRASKSSLPKTTHANPNAGGKPSPAGRLNQRPLQFLHFGPSLGPTGAVLRSRTFIDAERLDVARQGRGLPGLEAQRTMQAGEISGHERRDGFGRNAVLACFAKPPFNGHGEP